MTDPLSPPAATVLGLDARALLERVMHPPAGYDAMTIGDYEVVRRIAQGGMGIVYEARQISLQRTVALKMISSGLLATEGEVERFRREAEAAASLDHPNIVPIYEIGEEDGQHFFSMKLLEGGNLAELSAARDAATRRSPAWMRRAAGIVAGMARAVHHAHQRGVLHRDLKPTNVVLDEHGAPLLTDFGLAKLADRDPGLTGTVTMLGTPGYMAPEQAAGHTARLTVAADIYSLGAVLYDLLGGHPPFSGDSTLEVLRKVREQEPPALRRSNPGLNRDLETICHKCLQKEPDRRFRSAEALADDIDRWLAGQPILSRPVSRGEKVWLWARRHPAAATVALLVLALAIVSTIAALRLRAQRDEINESLARAYLSEARARRGTVEADRRSQGLAVLTEAARIKASPRGRDEVIATLALPELGPLVSWRDYVPEICPYPRSVSPDGTRLVIFKSGAESAVIYRREDGATLMELKMPPQAHARVWFSPDDRWLVLHDDARNAWIWDLHREGHGPHEAARKIPGPWTANPVWAPDSTLVLADAQPRARFFDPSSGTEVRQVPLPALAEHVAVSPRGDMLAIASISDLRTLTLDPPQQTAASLHQGLIKAVAWHPQGRLVAAGYESGEIQLFDSRSSESRWFTAHQSDVRSLAFHPGGEVLASSAMDLVQRIYHTADGRVLFEAKGSGHVHFTADGRHLVIADNAITAREWRASPVFRTLASATTGYHHIADLDLSPDGRWLVAGGRVGPQIWELATGRLAAHAPSDAAWCVRFHPRDNMLVTGWTSTLLRWPWSVGPDGAFALGAPETILSRSEERYKNTSFTPDGGRCAVAGSRENQVLDWPECHRLSAHVEETFGGNQPDLIVIGHDAGWVASASFNGLGVTIWNAADGAALRLLLDRENAALALSPDGRTLATGAAREVILWDTATWQPRARLPVGLSGNVRVPVAFSADGSLLAAAVTLEEIHLFDPASAARRAILTPPLPIVTDRLVFAPDGRHLAVSGVTSAVLHIWDLETLRAGLRKMRLDW